MASPLQHPNKQGPNVESTNQILKKFTNTNLVFEGVNMDNSPIFKLNDLKNKEFSASKYSPRKELEKERMDVGLYQDSFNRRNIWKANSRKTFQKINNNINLNLNPNLNLNLKRMHNVNYSQNFEATNSKDKLVVFPSIKKLPIETDLMNYWTNSLIPSNFRKVFLSSIEEMTIEQKEIVCKAEIKLLRENRALVQKIEGTKVERIELIEVIRKKCKDIASNHELLEQLNDPCDPKDSMNPKNPRIPSIVSEMHDLLLELRKITLQYVETIMKYCWQLYNNFQNSRGIFKKDYFSEIGTLFPNLNTKLTDDISFLIQSPLARKFRLADYDPFLTASSCNSLFSLPQTFLSFPSFANLSIPSNAIPAMKKNANLNLNNKYLNNKNNKNIKNQFNQNNKYNNFHKILIQKEDILRIQNAKRFLENKPDKYFQYALSPYFKRERLSDTRLSNIPKPKEEDKHLALSPENKTSTNYFRKMKINPTVEKEPKNLYSDPNFKPNLENAGLEIIYEVVKKTDNQIDKGNEKPKPKLNFESKIKETNKIVQIIKNHRSVFFPPKSEMQIEANFLNPRSSTPKHISKNYPTLVPMDIKQIDIAFLNDNYFPQLSKEMRESFIDLEFIFSGLKLYEEIYVLSYRYDETIEGLGIICTQHNKELKRKATILSATVINEINFLNLMTQLIKYIKVNIPCKEIKVSVKPIADKKENQVKAYSVIKTTFQKLNIKFRFKSQDTRFNVISYYLNQNTLTAPNTQRSSHFVEYLNNCTLVYTKQIIPKECQKNSETYEIGCKIEALREICKSFDKLNRGLNQIASVNEIKEEDCILLKNEHKIFQNAIKIFLNHVHFLNSKSLLFTNLYDYIPFMGATKDYFITEEFGLVDYDSILISIVSQNVQIKIEFFEVSLYEVDTKEYKFLGIGKNFIVKTIGNVKVYVFPSSESRFDSFIIDTYERDNLDNIIEQLKECNNFSELGKELWVPAFIQKKDCTRNRINLLETPQGFLNTIFEGVKIKFDNERPKNECTELQPKDDSIILKEPFIFGIIDKEIFKVLGIPILYSAISKEDWISN